MVAMSVSKLLKTIFLFSLIVVPYLFLYYELLVEKYRKHNYNTKLPFPSLLRLLEARVGFRVLLTIS